MSVGPYDVTQGRMQAAEQVGVKPRVVRMRIASLVLVRLVLATLQLGPSNIFQRETYIVLLPHTNHVQFIR